MDLLRTVSRKRRLLTAALATACAVAAILTLAAVGVSRSDSAPPRAAKSGSEAAGLWGNTSDVLNDPSVVGIPLGQARASAPAGVALPTETAVHPMRKAIVERGALDDKTTIATGAMGVLYAPDIEVFAEPAPGWTVAAEAMVTVSPGSFTDGRQTMHEVTSANGYDILVTRGGKQDLGMYGTHVVPNSIAWKVGDERYLVRSYTVGIDELVKFAVPTKK
jgi:hypothetical protein